jgi:hypothetical protein
MFYSKYLLFLQPQKHSTLVKIPGKIRSTDPGAGSWNPARLNLHIPMGSMLLRHSLSNYLQMWSFIPPLRIRKLHHKQFQVVQGTALQYHLFWLTQNDPATAWNTKLWSHKTKCTLNAHSYYLEGGTNYSETMKINW